MLLAELLFRVLSVHRDRKEVAVRSVPLAHREYKARAGLWVRADWMAIPVPLVQSARKARRACLLSVSRSKAWSLITTISRLAVIRTAMLG